MSNSTLHFEVQTLQYTMPILEIGSIILIFSKVSNKSDYLDTNSRLDAMLWNLEHL